MLLPGHEAAAAARGLPSISSFHSAAGSQPCHHAVATHQPMDYQTSSSSSAAPPSMTAAADTQSSTQQTGAALGRALASVCISFLPASTALLTVINDRGFSW